MMRSKLHMVCSYIHIYRERERGIICYGFIDINLIEILIAYRYTSLLLQTIIGGFFICFWKTIRTYLVRCNVSLM